MNRALSILLAALLVGAFVSAIARWESALYEPSELWEMRAERFPLPEDLQEVRTFGRLTDAGNTSCIIFEYYVHVFEAELPPGAAEPVAFGVFRDG